MLEVNPDGDPDLCARLVDGYQDAVDWVRSFGVEVREPETRLGFGRGCATDMAKLLSTCEGIVREADQGEVNVAARPERPLFEAGRVRGAEVVSGPCRRTILARSTLLATGGFDGDPDLRAQRIHPRARDLPAREPVQHR